MLWDIHMHTHHSGDSEADPEDMIQAAINRQLGGICFTDHLDYDYPEEPDGADMFLLDIDQYLPSIRKIQENYRNRFPVLCGIELGLQPHLAERHQLLLRRHNFDFVIGSSHLLWGADPYYPSFFDGKAESEVYRAYFESILENLLAFDGFDVYGHLDYIVRYGPTKNENYSYGAYQEILDEVLKTLIAKGKGIEVNTGGLKYGLGHPNPAEDVLRRYRELGGEILTLGADAHAPEYVGYDFHKLPDLLKSCGFSYFTVFKNRTPEFIKL